MKTLLGTLLAVVSSLAASHGLQAQSQFSVDLLSPSREYLHVDGHWDEAAECVQAKISVSKAATAPTVKAYFFGADGKLLGEISEPSVQADSLGGTVKPIQAFEAGKKYQVFFAIPSSMKSGAKKWKRVIVVFGSGSDFAARIYPKDDIGKFDFAEKSAGKAS